MYQSFMPDEIGRSSKVSAVPYQFFMSHQFNKLYYNPAVKYVPPPAPPGTTPVDADGRSVTDGTLGNAKYTDAWFNGYDLVGRNQSGYYASDLQLTISGCSKATVANATNTAYRRFNLDTSFTPTNDWSGAYSTNYSSFYPISGQCPLLGGAWKFSEFLGGAPTGRASYYVCPPDVWKNYPAHTASAVDYDHWLCQQKYLTNDEEKQNFANWYAYYRTRNYASKAGIGRAFEKLDPGVRVGWGLINKISFSSMDGKSVDTVMQGVRKFDQTRKKIFFDWLYKIQPANMKNPYLVNQLPADERDEKGGTPLRKALDSAGRYYDRSDGSSLGPWADDPAKPGTAATEKAAACRKSFTILMTDGYWNGSSAPTPGISGVNVDGSAPAPFKDSYANTLADVAWYYWKKDLLPSVASKVPKSPVPGLPGKYRDDATHQHMTTFTIGLGVAGTIDKNKAFRAIYDPSVGTITWRDPGVNADPDTLDPAFTTAKIDDLLHAAVNGHGDFFSAGNPDEFVTGMSAIIDTINSEQQIASGNIDAMEGTAQGSFILKTYYKPGDWRGELIAQKITNLAGLDLENERWLASEEMPAPAVRRIYTRNSQKKGVPFMWGNLQDTTLQNALKGPGQLLDGQKVLDYIRG
ncbi:MAG: hypothetical protein LBP99_05815, partial [Azoarcus sp.]|nr:hypothetical protein [Azoarcus sp.]